MKILDIKVLRGPNRWSTYRKSLIQMQLDIGRYEDFPTNKLSNFGERLREALPSMQSHRCSLKKPGGFFERVKEGTYLGHVIEHVALELQSLAGMPCGYGRTRSTGTRGIYHVVFAYEVEEAGVLAAKMAVNLIESIAEGLPVETASMICKLNQVREDKALGPSTASIVKAASSRGIPVLQPGDDGDILLGHGKFQQRISATITGKTSFRAVEIAGDKAETKRILSAAGIPVPEGLTVSHANELNAVIAQLGYPLVLKPLSGNHGRGITTNVNNQAKAFHAFGKAKQISSDVVVEQFVKGSDYRLLVINYKLVAAAKRVPAFIVGNGVDDIKTLIDELNTDPNRGEGHEKVLTKVTVDHATEAILEQQNLSLTSVLPAGCRLRLKDTANISSGGTATDVTETVHPSNVFMAERVARLIGLDVCGIDVVTEDIAAPIVQGNGAVIEVNAAPGFRMHLCPQEGLPRNVAEPVIDMLFPNEHSGRIPLVAVTGTNGKTSTTRLIAYLASQAGHKVGYTTTDGICIDGHLIQKGDCSGPQSARVVLSDPYVDFAVLECARGGILRAGLGFDRCCTSVVTNVAEDHLGLSGINTLAQLAAVKAVVPATTLDKGYAILNADDDLVYEMRRDLDCKIALFSTSDDNPRIKRHCDNGGLACILREGYFVLIEEGWQKRVARIDDVPLTMQGKAWCMICNTLPAILASYVNGISIEKIRSGLLAFKPTPESTPGRMNLFEFNHFQVLIDYAHNPAGFEMLKQFLARSNARHRVGIVGCAGDRRDDDIIAMGQCAAEMFDEIVIRLDTDNRGRHNDEIIRLIQAGIEMINPGLPVRIIADEIDALRYSIGNAKDDSIIVLCADEIEKSIAFVSQSMAAEPRASYFEMEQNY